MTKVKKHKVERVLERFNESLEDNSDAQQNVYTPLVLCGEILGKIDNLSEKSLLVLFNVEFAIAAKYNYNVKDITVYCECDEREEFAKSFGFKIIRSLDENMKKFDVVAGNPPYNDGSAANIPIYQNFIADVHNYIDPKEFVFIVQANWMMRQDKLSSEIRSHVTTMGIKELIYNPLGTFENADVATTTLVCEHSYKDDILFSNRETGKSRNITRDEFLKHQILDIFDDGIISILKKLKPVKSWGAFKKAKKYEGKPCVVTSYQNGNWKKDPFGQVRSKIAGDNYGVYRLLEVVEKEDDLKDAIERHKSFWLSNLVTFIMKFTRFSNTIDGSQIKWVPLIDISKKWTDEELYEHFNLTDEEISIINAHVYTNGIACLTYIDRRYSDTGLVDMGDNIFTTSEWIISEDRIKKLKYISIHNKQDSNSYIGGEILDIFPSKDDPKKYTIQFKKTDLKIAGKYLNWGVGSSRAYF